LLTCGSSTKALCAHYGMTPTRNEALLLRGSGDFADLVRIAASSMRWSDAPTLAGARRSRSIG
jgi:hypothetical protein